MRTFQENFNGIKLIFKGAKNVASLRAGVCRAIKIPNEFSIIAIHGETTLNGDATRRSL